MNRPPDAMLVEERRHGGVGTWWTLLVRGGFAMSASYPTEARALVDAQFWCGLPGVVPQIEVVRLEAAQ